ncbi:HalX domain-containing protein [Halorientalis pallida]|uniref:HalX domain-containing protein n=1 Tax=Halorientalis pallida TaxID=2479928 RepID=UPI003C7055F4
MTERDDRVLVVGSSERAATYDGWLDDWATETVEDVAELLSTVTADVAAIVVEAGVTDGFDRLFDELVAREIDRPVVVISDDAAVANGLGLRFTEYLVRPLEPETLREAVATAAAMSDEAVRRQTYLSLAASQATLELELTPTERADHDTYERHTERLDQLRARSETPLDELEERVSGHPN